MIKKGFLAFVAIEDGNVIGFKRGYELEEGVFYSWLGGVHPPGRSGESPRS